MTSRFRRVHAGCATSSPSRRRPPRAAVGRAAQISRVEQDLRVGERVDPEHQDRRPRRAPRRPGAADRLAPGRRRAAAGGADPSTSRVARTGSTASVVQARRSSAVRSAGTSPLGGVAPRRAPRSPREASRAVDLRRLGARREHDDAVPRTRRRGSCRAGRGPGRGRRRPRRRPARGAPGGLGGRAAGHRSRGRSGTASCVSHHSDGSVTARYVPRVPVNGRAGAPPRSPPH